MDDFWTRMERTTFSSEAQRYNEEMSHQVNGSDDQDDDNNDQED